MELRVNVSFQDMLAMIKEFSPEELQKLKNEVDKRVLDSKQSQKKKIFGRMKGFVKYMADDFNEPLEDFKDYM